MRNFLSFHLRNSRGSALLISLGILLLISLLAVTSVETSRVEIDIAGNEVRRSQALWAAEAGLAQTEAVLKAHPKEQNVDTLMKWINVPPVNTNATFQVSMESGLPLRKVISLGTGHESQAAVQVLYRYTANPYNIWNNVLFAGHGQNGLAINGNTGLHGSVHILGDGEKYVDANKNGKWDSGETYADANHDGGYDPPVSPTTTSLSLSGSATVSNNYAGLQAVLASRAPALPVVPFGGENVQTINGEFRVQHGKVSLDGASQVGAANVSGGSPAVKETMDAVWVNDGFTGSAGVSGVNSDNGYEETYDFEEPGVEMPNLDESYVDQSGVSYATYMDYLKSSALVIPGDLTIECGKPVPPKANTYGSIHVDPFGNMTATGVVYVQGNVNIIGKCPINYDGKFTLVSEKDTNIDTDFFSKDKFATDDVAGIVSNGTLQLGVNASQLRLSGAFYAQEEVKCTKQTQVLGTLVANYFDLVQVPHIYQVPDLVKNLPPRLPGGDIWMYAWRRVPKSWTELY